MRSFLCGALLGGMFMYILFQTHFVWTADGVVMIPRHPAIPLNDSFADTRDWDRQQWTDHVRLRQAFENAGRTDLIIPGTQNGQPPQTGAESDGPLQRLFDGPARRAEESRQRFPGFNQPSAKAEAMFEELPPAPLHSIAERTTARSVANQAEDGVGSSSSLYGNPETSKTNRFSSDATSRFGEINDFDRPFGNDSFDQSRDDRKIDRDDPFNLGGSQRSSLDGLTSRDSGEPSGSGYSSRATDRNESGSAAGRSSWDEFPRPDQSGRDRSDSMRSREIIRSGSPVDRSDVSRDTAASGAVLGTDQRRRSSTDSSSSVRTRNEFSSDRGSRSRTGSETGSRGDESATTVDPFLRELDDAYWGSTNRTRDERTRRRTDSTGSESEPRSSDRPAFNPFSLD